MGHPGSWEKVGEHFFHISKQAKISHSHNLEELKPRAICFLLKLFGLIQTTEHVTRENVTLQFVYIIPWKVPSEIYPGLREWSPCAQGETMQASTGYRSGAIPNPLCRQPARRRQEVQREHHPSHPTPSLTLMAPMQRHADQNSHAFRCGNHKADMSRVRSKIDWKCPWPSWIFKIEVATR